MNPRLPALKRRALLAFAVLGLAFPSFCEAGLKIYYLRHAEQGGNVTHKWADVPKDQWPSYVGQPVFTPLGEEQVAQIPAKLKPYRFDFIATSPLWRARHTILPWLKEHDRQAEVWSELTEFSYKSIDPKLVLQGSKNLPPPSEDLLTGGGAIDIEPESAQWFTLLTADQREIKFGRSGAEGTADVVTLFETVIDRIEQRFGHEEKSILLVGHNNAGTHLLRTLLKGELPRRESIRNISLWMVERQPDGAWQLKLFNDRPVAEAQPERTTQP